MLEVWFLGHTVVVLLVFQGCSVHIFIMTEFYPNQQSEKFPFLCTLIYSCLLVFPNSSSYRLRCNLLVVLTCIYLIVNYVEYFFTSVGHVNVFTGEVSIFKVLKVFFLLLSWLSPVAVEHVISCYYYINVISSVYFSSSLYIAFAHCYLFPLLWTYLLVWWRLFFIYSAFLVCALGSQVKIHCQMFHGSLLIVSPVPAVSVLMFKSLLYLELSTVCGTRVQFHSFVCRCLIFPTPFIEETTLFPL